MTKLRIGIVGAGSFGRRHVDTITDEPSCELVAIADPAPGAIPYAAQQRVEHFEDLTAMLDRARPDGVIIATPNTLHVPAGLACVQRGIPMLIEKPIADTVESARQLSDAAERASVAVLVGHHRRHNPVIAKAREIVREGKIGRLTAVAALWLIQKPASYFDVSWRRERGGGPVLINLIHDIDDLRFICGDIASVQAFASSATRGFPVEDTAAIALRFVNGALGTVTVSDAVAAPWSWEITSGEAPNYPQRPENCYFFAGTEASLTVPKLELWHYPGESGWGAPLASESIAVEHADPLVRQLQHFCRVIRGEEQPRVSGADATRTLAATLAVHEAAQTRRPVVLG